MKWALTIVFSIILVISLLILQIDAKQNALAYFAGGVLVTANIALTFYVWRKLFEKKLVALATGLIVIKYAIFGVIIYFIFTRILTAGTLQPIWFGVGVGSGSFSLILAMHFLDRFKVNETEH